MAARRAGAWRSPRRPRRRPSHAACVLSGATAQGDLKVKIEEIDGKIKTLQDRLNVIKDTLDARESGRGDSPEVARSKAHLNEAKSKCAVPPHPPRPPCLLRARARVRPPARA